MYCANCGKIMPDEAVSCAGCGAVIYRPEKEVEGEGKWEKALVLCFLVGFLGIHRFYLKDMKIATWQLMLGFLSLFIVSIVWSTIDMLKIMNGTFRTGDGRLLRMPV